MPTVPVAPVARTENKPIGTPYDDGRGVSIGAFGGDQRGALALGAGMDKVSDALGRAAADLQERDDSVSRIKAISEFKNTLNNRARVLSTTADLADNEPVQAYNAEVKTAKQKFLEAHQKGGASGSSLARLEARLEAEAGGLIDRMSDAGYKAKIGRVDRVVKEQAGEFFQQAQLYPDQLKNIGAGIINFLNDFDPGMGPENRAAHEKYLVGSAVRGAVDGILDRGGNPEEALKVIYENPGLYTPEQLQALQSRIGEKTKAAARGQRYHTMPDGRVLDTQTGAVSGKVTDQFGTVPDGRVLNKRTGAVSGTPAEKDPKSLIQLENEAEKLASVYEQAGGFTPEQEKTFVNLAGRVVTGVFDPLTKTKSGGTLPENQAKILESLGYEVPADARSPLVKKGAPAEKFDPAAEGLPPDSAVGKLRTGLGNDVTLFHVVGDQRGPLSALAKIAGKTPGLGTGSKAQDAAQLIAHAIEGLASDIAKRGGSRADAEIKRILAAADLTPQAWGNETEGRRAIVNLDRTLEAWITTAKSTLGGKVSGKERQESLDTVATLTAFRKVLMPPRLDTAEQRDAFRAAKPNGTEYTYEKAPDVWVTYRVKKEKAGG